MSRSALHSTFFTLLLAAVAAASLGALALGGGEPVVAVLPPLLVAALWVFWKLPLRTSALALLFLVLAVDYIPERAQSGLWQSPLYLPGRLLLEQLSSVTGIGALHFPLMDPLVLGLLAVAAWRRATGASVDPPGWPLPGPLKQTLALAFATLVWMELWGAARGGDVRNSLWQMHQLGFIPLLAILYTAALRGPEDHRALARVIVAAACVKALIGAYFIVFIARPAGWDPEFATCHSDSVTYVAAVTLVLSPWAGWPRRRHLPGRLLLLAVLGTGLYFNDRRLAYVSLVGALVMLFLIAPWSRLKRSLARAALLVVPVLPLYVAVGWSSGSHLFGPVHTLRSLVEGEAPSAGMDYRDIEDLNLIATWRRNPLLGTGFGHEFDEPIKLPDISFVFPEYRFHPHNSMLGLLAFGGALGLTGLWAYLLATVFLAARAHRQSRLPEHRAAARVIIAVVIAYVNQCFGDMGSISWITAFLVTVAAVCAGKLASAVGAWPGGHPAPDLSPRPREGALSTAGGEGGGGEAVAGSRARGP